MTTFSEATPDRRSTDNSTIDLTFQLDSTPSLISDGGDCVIICLARPNADTPLSRTLVLSSDQAALLDSYVSQTGVADVLDALVRHVGCLISGLVQTSMTEQQAAVVAAVEASVAQMQVE